MNSPTPSRAVTLTLSPHQSQLHCLAEQFGVAVRDNQFVYAGPLGELTMRGYFFAGGLSLFTYASTTREALALHTVNPADSGLYCLFINLSADAVSKQIGGETFAISSHSRNGILFYGPDLRITQQIPAGQVFEAVSLTFSSETLASMHPNGMAANWLPDPSGFVFLDLDRDTDRLLRTLLDPAAPASPTALRHYGRSIEFLADVFAKMAGRQQAGSYGLLQPQIDQLFEVRQLLLTHLPDPPTQAQLARTVGLSEASLRRYFPRLFGQPVHQYVQTMRMNQAHDLLATRQYSVSEVGFRVGYTNLTHFTNAYRRQFGHNPSAFLHDLKR